MCLYNEGKKKPQHSKGFTEESFATDNFEHPQKKTKLETRDVDHRVSVKNLPRSSIPGRNTLKRKRRRQPQHLILLKKRSMVFYSGLGALRPPLNGPGSLTPGRVHGLQPSRTWEVHFLRELLWYPFELHRFIFRFTRDKICFPANHLHPAGVSYRLKRHPVMPMAGQCHRSLPTLPNC